MTIPEKRLRTLSKHMMSEPFYLPEITTMKSILFASALFLLIGAQSVRAQEISRLVDLRGQWKFEAGDDKAWANPKFNDNSWESIRVPSPWEEQGYPGYDGYGWYRKHFKAPKGLQGKMLILKVGAVDDVDETYVNGRFIGFCGQFPPTYESEYSVQREYQIPAWLLHEGDDNVIAVRVYDDQMNGGITGGEVGLYEVRNPPFPDASLDGMWKFQKGDSPEWKSPGFDDGGWGTIYVPTYWETQGYKGYDGIGWYRLHFQVDPKFEGKRMVFLLGKIDDYDEAYLNGQVIGKTGAIPADGNPGPTGRQYSWLRTYTIPVGLLKVGEENILAVRVWDGRLHGGIYQGPIGLITRDRYNDWRSNRKSPDGPMDFLIDIFSK